MLRLSNRSLPFIMLFIICSVTKISGDVQNPVHHFGCNRHDQSGFPQNIRQEGICGPLVESIKNHPGGNIDHGAVNAQILQDDPWAPGDQRWFTCDGKNLAASYCCGSIAGGTTPGGISANAPDQALDCVITPSELIHKPPHRFRS